MKKSILISAIILFGLIQQNANAQVHLSFGVNIGVQPVWGPVGYDHVEYYYMPDIDAYYYVPNHQYIYQERGRWLFSASLPGRYNNYDINNGYKVVINEPRPYLRAESYRVRYAGYRGNHNQEIIRNSNDSRYFENRGHPQYNNWRNQRRRENNDRQRGNYDRQRGNNDRQHGDNDRQRGNSDKDNGNNGHGNGNKGHKG